LLATNVSLAHSSLSYVQPLYHLGGCLRAVEAQLDLDLTALPDTASVSIMVMNYRCLGSQFKTITTSTVCFAAYPNCCTTWSSTPSYTGTSLVVHATPTRTCSPAPPSFPAWVIVLIIIGSVAMLGLLGYLVVFILRRARSQGPEYQIVNPA